MHLQGARIRNAYIGVQCRRYKAKNGTKGLRYQKQNSFINVCCYLFDMLKDLFKYSETLNNEYIERIRQMSYSSLSDNGMLQIFSFLIK